MTVGELIDFLKDIDRNAVIVCSDNCGGGYTLGDVYYEDEYNEVQLS
jgi:hypothetical protein